VSQWGGAPVLLKGPDPHFQGSAFVWLLQVGAPHVGLTCGILDFQLLPFVGMLKYEEPQNYPRVVPWRGYCDPEPSAVITIE
jgi:hypothetical protein